MLKDAVGRLLLVRADGGARIGFSHVMRSTALAEEWLKRGGQCLWATTEPRSLDEAGAGREDLTVVVVDSTPGSVDDARITRALAEKNSVDWVYADMSACQPDYFACAGARRVRWMIACDVPLHVNERIDAILNPSPHALAAQYPGRSERCRMLLGLDYALIRSEFRERYENTAIRRNPPERLLITFGGSDPADFTRSTLRALAGALPPLPVRCRVILGPGYRGEFAERGANFENLEVEFVRYTSNMGAHYRWADLIVCGAGLTLWEAFHFGLPTVVMPITEDQRMTFEALSAIPVVRRFEKPGAEFCEWIAVVAAGEASGREWLASASEAGPRMVDGNGARRLVDMLLAAN